MECYNIEWRPSTKKDLKKISKAEVHRIISAVEGLSGQPRPPGSTKLSGSDLTYRIRVENYRVIYEIHDKIILIEVVKVGHRKDVYRK